VVECLYSLAEANGGVKTATVRTGKHPVAVDRKIKFFVNELKRFRMGAVCISKTKWFGSDVYEVRRWFYSVALWPSLASA